MVSFVKKLVKAKYQPGFCKVVLLMVSVLFTFHVQAQNALEVPVKVDIENGNVDDVLVKVMKDGRSIFTQSSVSKMKLKLNFNSTYTIVFSKPGYVTKSIEFDTKAPADHIKDGFDAYKIGVKLFKQYDGVNTTVYNQPVGKIRFDKELDEFNYDTDYSKSILSKLQEVEDKLAAKAEEEKQNVKPEEKKTGRKKKESEVEPEPEKQKEIPVASVPPAIEIEKVSTSNAAVVQQVPPPSKSINQGSDVAISSHGSGGEQTKDLLAMDGSNDIGSGININQGMDAGKANNKANGMDARPSKIKRENGTDPNNGNIPNTIGNDRLPDATVHNEMERITREDFVERNRIITIVRVTKGKTTTAYRRVNYHWGGPFYFKNDVSSISQEIFVFATGIKN